MWGTFHTGEFIVHTCPIDDTYEHLLNMDCWCKPTHEIYGEDQIQYIHNAHDDKEHREPDHDKSRCVYCIAKSS